MAFVNHTCEKNCPCFAKTFQIIGPQELTATRCVKCCHDYLKYNQTNVFIISRNICKICLSKNEHYRNLLHSHVHNIREFIQTFPETPYYNRLRNEIDQFTFDYYYNEEILLSQV